jgi:hypothetical protein
MTGLEQLLFGFGGLVVVALGAYGAITSVSRHEREAHRRADSGGGGSACGGGGGSGCGGGGCGGGCGGG